MIVVTTPTGMIGSQVLAKLLAAGEQIRVIARDPSRLPADVSAKVEVVQGSHGDGRIVGEAFKGADAVFWLPPPNPTATSVEAVFTGFARPACEAIRQQGVKHVVGISGIGRGTAIVDRAGYVTASLAMDEMIAATGTNFRALAMPSFMDNMLRQAAAIRNEGVFFSPISGDRKLPTCATRDIADAAARLLLDRSWRGQGHVAVLGPEDLSFNDMAAIMTDVLEKPVRFQQIPLDAYKVRLIEFGMSEAMAQGMIDMMRAKDNGLDNGELRTAENTTPTSFRQWCTDVLKPAVLG